MKIRSDEELIEQMRSVKAATENLLDARESLACAIALRVDHLGQSSLMERRAEQIEAADGSMERARAHLSAAQGGLMIANPLKELVQEVMAWHRDPESSEYNECEKDPCEWCVKASKAMG